MGIIGWIVLGLLAGAIAKAILPGDDPGGIIVTMIIGIVGALLGGFLGQARPDFVVCDSETCRWHIAKATGLPVYHPVQVLDRAYQV